VRLSGTVGDFVQEHRLRPAVMRPDAITNTRTFMSALGYSRLFRDVVLRSPMKRRVDKYDVQDGSEDRGAGGKN